MKKRKNGKKKMGTLLGKKEKMGTLLGKKKNGDAVDNTMNAKLL
ncbi:MAG TPA: hypothetical protein VMF69_09270 [Gemmataceae bacterium]|nr:hypothetical protein [Gemmataceae bacterium]